MNLNYYSIYLVIFSIKPKQKNILFIPTYHASLNGIIPVIEYLNDNNDVKCKVVLRNSNMKLERSICENHDIDYIIFKRHEHNHSNTRNFENKSNKNFIDGKNIYQNSLKKLITYIRSFNTIDRLYRNFYTIKRIFNHQSLTYKNSYKLLKSERPSVVIVMNDTRIDLELFLLKVSKYLGIPTIQIGWSWIQTISQYIQLQLHRESHGVVKKYSYWKIILCKYLIPDIYGEIDSKPTLFNDPLTILVSKIFGLKSSSPVNKGKSVNALTVPSTYQKNIYLNRGVNKNKIYVTGDASNDKLVYLRKVKHQIKSSIISALKLKESDIIITIASSPLGFVTTNINQSTIDLIKMLLDISPKIQVIFKPHPAEDSSEFKYLNNISNKVTITKSYAVSHLATISDLFITIASSSLIDAVALDVPVIIYDFTQVNYIDRYSYTKSVKRVFDLKSMKIAVEEILFKFSGRKKTIKMQRNKIKPFAILDGKCTQRTASVIMNYIK